MSRIDFTSACASSACSGVAVRPVPIAHTGSYAIARRSRWSSWTTTRSASTCRRTTASVSPASRSAAVSPTHAITLRPPSSAPSTRRAAVSSVSANICRRSEWAMIAPVTPSSRSIGAETSPVYGPSPAQWTFWAKTATDVPASTVIAWWRDVCGGQTTTSTPSISASRSRSAAQNSAVSEAPLNIFQLPAISTASSSQLGGNDPRAFVVHDHRLVVRQRDELEPRAESGGDVGKLGGTVRRVVMREDDEVDEAEPYGRTQTRPERRVRRRRHPLEVGARDHSAGAHPDVGQAAAHRVGDSPVEAALADRLEQEERAAAVDEDGVGRTERVDRVRGAVEVELNDRQPHGVERGPAAGRDPRDVVGEPGVMQRAHRIGATDDREPVDGGDGLGHRLRPLHEPRPFEDAHRAVPEHRLRRPDPLGEEAAGLRPDIEPEPAVRELVVRHNASLRVRLERL